MSDAGWKPLERYCLAYQRLAVACLLFAVAGVGYFVAVVFGGLGGRPARDAAGVLVALFTVSWLVVPLVTLRGRILRRSDPRLRTVLRDEWTRTNRHRAFRAGFAVAMWAQVPLALLMQSFAAEPSYAGMAGLSMTLGGTAFFATYLHRGRQPGDG